MSRRQPYSCAIQRLVRVTPAIFNADGAVLLQPPRWREEPCSRTLRDPWERQLGVCNPCLDTWEGDGNKLTDEGRAAVALAGLKLFNDPDFEVKG